MKPRSIRPLTVLRAGGMGGLAEPNLAMSTPLERADLTIFIFALVTCKKQNRQQSKVTEKVTKIPPAIPRHVFELQKVVKTESKKIQKL